MLFRKSLAFAAAVSAAPGVPKTHAWDEQPSHEEPPITALAHSEFHCEAKDLVFCIFFAPSASKCARRSTVGIRLGPCMAFIYVAAVSFAIPAAVMKSGRLLCPRVICMACSAPRNLVFDLRAGLLRLDFVGQVIDRYICAARARATAAARPIPRLLPVTRAVLPFNSSFMG